MSRPLRVEYEGAYYHVMNRGLERRKIALKDQDFEEFVTLLKDISSRWGVKIFAYCLMSNHYHVFMQTSQANLSRVMRHVDGVYTQRFNRSYHRDGPLFRGRYRAIVVDGESYLLSLVRYIHLNPVKAKIVKLAGEYKWSSHQNYLKDNKKSESWMGLEEVLCRFKNIKGFDGFVNGEDDKNLENFYNKKRQSSILGEKDFIEEVREKTGEFKNGSRMQRNPEFRNLKELCEYAGAHLKMNQRDLLKSRPGVENLSRDLVIYLASRKAGFSHAEIKRYLNVKSESTVSKACQRIDSRKNKDAKLKINLYQFKT